MDTDGAERNLFGLACGVTLGPTVELDSPSEIKGKHGTRYGMIDPGTWNPSAATITGETGRRLSTSE